MAGHATEVRESKAPEKRSYRKLEEMHIKKVKGPNGGHLVTHHFGSDGVNFHKPEEHMFGKDEGPEMIEHVARHLGVRSEEPEEAEAEPEGKPEEEND
jgi:hypothetical protein